MEGAGNRYDTDGYVLCRKCGKAAWDISKATSWEYAYHVACRPWNLAEQARQERKQAFFRQKEEERRRVKEAEVVEEIGDLLGSLQEG